jgi:RNAse (barnase) inhibitor barstar
LKKIILNFTRIQDMAAFHRIIQCALDLPAYYGQNLDALHDCVEEMVPAPQVTVIYGGSLPDNRQHLIASILQAEE